jgi:hypothetical protein
MVLPHELDKLLKEPLGELVNDKTITKKKFNVIQKMLAS